MQSTWWMCIVLEARGDATVSLRVSMLVHSVYWCDSKRDKWLWGSVSVSWVRTDWELTEMRKGSPVIILDELRFDPPCSHAPAKTLMRNRHAGVMQVAYWKAAWFCTFQAATLSGLFHCCIKKQLAETWTLGYIISPSQQLLFALFFH